MILLTHLFIFIIGFFCLFSNAQLLERAADSSEIPSCSVDCLTTLVPEYGCSLTNATCLCTNAPLIADITACAESACNVTDIFRLAKYQADSCGVKNNKTKQVRQIYGLLIEFAFVILFVAARFYSRISLNIGIGLDDWMILVATAIYIVDVGTGICIPLNGFGQHTWFLTTKQVERSLMFFYISEPLYLLAITCTKISILFFFLRIFPNERMNWVIYAVMGFIVVTNAILTLTLAFQCIPFHANWTNWEYKVAPIKCVKQYAAIFSAAGFSIFHDLLIVLIPVPVLWRLNLDTQKKIGLIFMFSVGIFVVICSLIRMPSLTTLENSSDPSWDQSSISIWTGLETCVGIMCACLPAIRSLVSHLFPSLKMSLNTGDKATPSYNYNSRSLAGGSQTLPKSKLSQIRRTDSQASFFELDERERGQGQTETTTDGGSAFSKNSRESIPTQSKGEPGVTTTNIDIGNKDDSGKEFDFTKHAK